jgi:Spy/CpxP family protein refolding chaperone
MNMKRIATTAAMAAALGLGALSAGAGPAQADKPWNPWPWPIPPAPSGPGPGVLPPPGHIGQIVDEPPGQWNKGPLPPPELVPLLPFCPDLNPGCINHL